MIRCSIGPVPAARSGAPFPGLVFLAACLVGGLIASWASLPAAAQTYPLSPQEEAEREESKRRERADASSRVLDLDDHRDPRSVELMRWDCQDELGRRDVTLFANGTVRSRRGMWGRREMRLEELGPLELGRYVIRLREIRADRDFPEELAVRGGVSGRWVGKCRFSLDVPGSEALTLEVGALDVLPLPLQQIRQVAEELESFTRPLRSHRQLPDDYEPRVGDVLVDARGQAFRVARWTLDGKGVELDSLDGTQRVYMLASDLSDVFVRLESRRR